MKFANASQKPKVFYGLHMAPGVAEYRDPKINSGKPYRILIEEQAIKNMNPTFTGCPVYVKHVDDVDLETLQEDADGYVVESFYNKADGKNWVKFIVVSDKGHNAIRNGWRLSNAYVPQDFSSGGQWHGVDYEKEVTRGEYEHLAIVPNPRYEESVIMTPEEFKAYNNEKEVELKKLSNSKGDSEMKFNLFKREKVTNEKELAGILVVLPESKKEVTVEQAIEIADKFENMHGYASDEHYVKVNDDSEMTVKELKKAYNKAMEDLEVATKDKDLGDVETDEHEKKNADDKEKEEKEKEKKKNAADEEAKAKEEEAQKDADKAEADRKKKAFEALKNANEVSFKDDEPIGELSSDRVARGQKRYGSKK